jgi:hypothetical protein
MSGIVDVDQPKAMYLVELALDLAVQMLPKGGVFVAKVFHGEGFDEWLKSVRTNFQSFEQYGEEYVVVASDSGGAAFGIQQLQYPGPERAAGLLGLYPRGSKQSSVKGRCRWIDHYGRAL